LLTSLLAAPNLTWDRRSKSLIRMRIGLKRGPCARSNHGRSVRNCSICFWLGKVSTRPSYNGRDEHYLIVACTVITDVPEEVGPCPVALMEKVSLPLYLAFALYSKAVALSFFNLPCSGFCKMSELLTVPRFVIGNRQLPPDATLMSAVEFWPQSASSANFGQSETASAGDTKIEPVAPTINANAATLDNRMVDFSFSPFLFRHRRTAKSMLTRGTFLPSTSRQARVWRQFAAYGLLVSAI